LGFIVTVLGVQCDASFSAVSRAPQHLQLQVSSL